MATDSELGERARAKGWPDGMLARAQALLLPHEIEFHLSADAWPLDELQRELDARVRTAKGPFRIREMNIRDTSAFSELWAHAPEKLGKWTVTVERSPNSLAQFQLHEDCSITVLEEGGALYACTAWSNRNVLIGGARVPVHVAHSMRVHESRRGEGFADLVRRYPRRAMPAKANMGQFMYVRPDNANVLGFLGKVANHVFGAVGAAGIRTVVSHLSPRPFDDDTRGIRNARREDLDACAALINRTHGRFDLFDPYTAETLAVRLAQRYPENPPPFVPHVYGWPDFYVLEDNDSIKACAGLWDRGRDVREVWRASDGEVRTLAVTNLLDFGYAEGAERSMTRLIGYLLGKTADLGRTSLVVPLDRLPSLAQACAPFEPRHEERTFEWTPFVRELPRTIPEPYTDLRFW